MALPAKQQQQRRFTPQQYLAFEAAALDKHEYHGGEVLAMSGGSYRHSRTISNLIRAIGNRLSGSPCFVLESNMRVRIEREDRYVYPDASIVCGEPVFDPLDNNQTTIINPAALVEVLSPSTEGYDRGDKFSAYRTLDSFVEYVLVSASRPLVETFFRQPDGNWVLRSYAGRQAMARVRSMKIDLPLSEVYEGVVFEADAARDQQEPPAREPSALEPPAVD